MLCWRTAGCHVCHICVSHLLIQYLGSPAVAAIFSCTLVHLSISASSDLVSNLVAQHTTARHGTAQHSTSHGPFGSITQQNRTATAGALSSSPEGQHLATSRLIHMHSTPTHTPTSNKYTPAASGSRPVSLLNSLALRLQAPQRHTHINAGVRHEQPRQARLSGGRRQQRQLGF